MSFNIELANFWIGVVLAAITFLAVIVALFGKKFWDWWNQPIVKIGYGDEEPFVITNYSGSVITRLFRIKAINQGKTIAKNCRIKVLSVYSENKSEKVVDDPDVLKWSSAPREMAYRDDPPGNIDRIADMNQLTPVFKKSKDITPYGGWEFCDLFQIDSQEKKVIFTSSGSRNFLAKDKKYIADIEISGDNLKPVVKEIKFSIQHKLDANLLIYLAKIEEIRAIS